MVNDMNDADTYDWKAITGTVPLMVQRYGWGKCRECGTRETRVVKKCTSAGQEDMLRADCSCGAQRVWMMMSL